MLEAVDLIKVALTSGVSASVVTFVANYFLKKQDYKRDYYKKIIDKRLKSYEELEKFLGGFCVKKEILDSRLTEKRGERFDVLACFCNEESLFKANTDILNIIQHSLWFSSDIRLNLLYINMVLSEVGVLLNKQSPIVEDEIKKYGLDEKFINEDLIIHIGHTFFDEIQGYTKAISVAIGKDLKDMHEVEKFLEVFKKEGNKN